ncbi:aldo/keto reductase [Methanohalobium evestigatum Z-7303]|uniref:Aldo/keto reductase n=1 Tax=Methanohalobium evestigatum (strain ATCC BAA-1072 / DSM 3721 / NBRC 107634 / OCM 161 / Z-7303) TaxID=644295 RepID=D7E7B3_METEZ|nr:aldo/keto reductase [Methanohalobium evestigatum]ADI73862.1 aldo/keto reductase [Methanohalobium evestigatum Z-7303]
MDYLKIPGTKIKSSRIGFGSQPTGYHDESYGLQAIHTAFEHGVNLIDTSPVYGNGRAEQIVGKALRNYDRDDVVIASKTGLEKTGRGAVRNSSPEFILKDIEGSLQRLGTDYIDIYQIHWPDPVQPFHETAEVMESLREEDRIKAIGVSNFSVEQMKCFSEYVDINTCQSPYNIFERLIEGGVIPYCIRNNITLLTYRSLCQGILTGALEYNTDYSKHPVKKDDPKFKSPRYEQYLDAVKNLANFVQNEHNKSMIDLAIQWILDKANTVALWGAWKPEHIDDVNLLSNWSVDKETRYRIEKIVNEYVNDPVGPEFLEPPSR